MVKKRGVVAELFLILAYVKPYQARVHSKRQRCETTGRGKITDEVTDSNNPPEHRAHQGSYVQVPINWFHGTTYNDGATEYGKEAPGILGRERSHDAVERGLSKHIPPGRDYPESPEYRINTQDYYDGRINRLE